MRRCRFTLPALAAVTLVPWLADLRAADHAAQRGGCTGPAPCRACVPACRSSWAEKRVGKPEYSMECEYACARARECWCTGPAECRCSPPCGRVYVRKKLVKEEKEEVEKAPKYEVKMVPAPPCDCDACRRGHRLCWWDPLRLLSCLWGG
jgi:hypothetical protein